MFNEDLKQFTKIHSLKFDLFVVLLLFYFFTNSVNELVISKERKHNLKFSTKKNQKL